MSVALIAGASGLVGNHLLHLLLKNDYFTQVVSVGRRKLPVTHSKLFQHIVDFENLAEESLKADHVFCCLGTTIKKAGSQEAFRKVDFTYPLELAKYGLGHGAKSFHVVTAMGAKADSKIFYSRIKGEVEEAIKALPFEQIHICRPTILLGERNESRVAEKVAQVVTKTLGFLFIGFLKKFKGIEAKQVAIFINEISLTDQKGIFVHSAREMQPN